MITLSDHMGGDPVLRLPADAPPLHERETASAKARQERELVDHFFAEMERTATGGMTRGLARLTVLEGCDVPEDMEASITPALHEDARRGKVRLTDDAPAEIVAKIAAAMSTRAIIEPADTKCIRRGKGALKHPGEIWVYGYHPSFEPVGVGYEAPVYIAEVQRDDAAAVLFVRVAEDDCA